METTKGMSTSTVFLNMYCDAYGLRGLNKLRCSIAGSRDYSAPTASKHVYLLCPGKATAHFN